MEARQPAAPALSRRDQMVAALFGLWMIIGLFLDGWAHDNQKPETFFTPWHGVLYTGFTGAAAFALHRAIRAGGLEAARRRTLPRGHGLTLVALGLFAVAAVSDLAWHEVFGIEVGVEALLSPTHLVLMASGLVALSAPVRAAWMDDDVAPTFRSFLPVALSTALLTALVAFFLLYLSPFSNDAAGTAFARFPGQTHEHPSGDVGELQQLLGVASILLTSVVVASPIALLLRRWRTPAGTFTLLLGLLVFLFVAVAEFRQPTVVLAGIAAGVTADGVSRRGWPAALVCGAATGVLWLGYFAFYAVDEGSVTWTAEVWSGTAFLGSLLGGAAGLLATPLPFRSRDPLPVHDDLMA